MSRGAGNATSKAEREAILMLRGRCSIPDGWHIEPSAYGPDISHVVWPGHGAASISWRRRSVALGWCIPPPVCDDVRPKGRRWREKLMEAAIDLLRKS